MDDKKFLKVSIAISIGLYLFLVLSLILYLHSKNVKAYDAMSKTTTIELEIIQNDSDPKDKQTQQQLIQKNQSELAKKIVDKSTSRSTKKTTNMKSLFGKTSIKAARVEKREVLNIKSSLTNSRYKSKFEKEKKLENIKMSNSLNKLEKASSKPQLKSKNENDPYFSKVYEILSARWQPTMIRQDLRAKVIVSITNSGSFSYNISQYSGDTSFDEQLMRFLDKQKNLAYPTHSKGSSVDIEIEFKAKKS